MEVNLSRGMPLQDEGSQVFWVQDPFAPEPLLKYMCHGHTLFMVFHDLRMHRIDQLGFPNFHSRGWGPGCLLGELKVHTYLTDKTISMIKTIWIILIVVQDFPLSNLFWGVGTTLTLGWRRRRLFIMHHLKRFKSRQVGFFVADHGHVVAIGEGGGSLGELGEGPTIADLQRCWGCPEQSYQRRR